MRKLFFLILVALLAGVAIVALIETDPGYVLIAYGNYTLESSVWVGLLLLLLFTGLVYLLLRLVRKLMAGQNSLVSWLGSRKSRKAARMTTQGLISFIEGNWTKSRRQLLQGTKGNDAPLLNYLTAARASYRLNDQDKMREYLGAAEASEAQAGIAVELTQAEMKLHAQQYEQALATLVRARRNAGKHPYVLNLLRKAYTGLNDWASLAELLPEIKKYKVLPPEQLQELQSTVYLQLLQSSSASSDGSAVADLHSQWQKLPAELRKNQAMGHAYVKLLIEHEASDATEKVISSKKSGTRNLCACTVCSRAATRRGNLPRQNPGWLAMTVIHSYLFAWVGWPRGRSCGVRRVIISKRVTAWSEARKFALNWAGCCTPWARRK
jgi:HemY protein